MLLLPMKHACEEALLLLQGKREEEQEVEGTAAVAVVVTVLIGLVFGAGITSLSSLFPAIAGKDVIQNAMTVAQTAGIERKDGRARRESEQVASFFFFFSVGEIRRLIFFSKLAKLRRPLDYLCASLSWPREN